MPIRTPLFVDRLSLTLDINSDDRQYVHDSLLGLAGDGDVLQVFGQKLLKDYQLAFSIPLEQEKSCIIQIHPRARGRRRYIRLEWNPSKSRNSIGYIEELLSSIIPSYTSNLILQANITRIDLSFDLRRIRMDSIFVHTTLRKSYSGRYLQVHEEHAPTGHLNALTLGKTDSDQYLVIYDKSLERKLRRPSCNANGEYRASEGDDFGRRAAPVTRFELRLRDIGPLEGLGSLSNPFERYTIRSFVNAGAAKADHAWQHFIDSCRWRGVQAALSLIEDRRTRTGYRDSLRSLEPPSWWNPVELWGEMPQAISRALLSG